MTSKRDDPIDVTLQVTSILEELNVPYAIGGSLASAVHGVMRATMDADLVAAMEAEHISPFVDALGDDFYADAHMIYDAVQRHTSFNILHIATMFKVDIFVAKARPFDQAQLKRRQLLQLGESTTQAAYVITAEDIILAKLEWYKLGGQVSERQWRDVLGVLKVQAEQLDRVYLQQMAQKLGVADILARAFREVMGNNR